MKTLKRIFALTVIVSAIGLSTSCTENNLSEDDVLLDELEQINKKEITEGAI